jgi:hypothetical protein
MLVYEADAHGQIQRIVSVVKMATVLEDCSKKGQSSVASFVGKRTQWKGYSQKMFPVYGGKCLSRKAVHKRVEKFSQERSKVADDNSPGRPVEIATEATVQRVEELIRADRRIMIDTLATALGCSHCLAYSIIHDRLKFRKMWARWVPREPKEREKIKIMGLSSYGMQMKEMCMLNRIVTGEESWVHD